MISAPRLIVAARLQGNLAEFKGQKLRYRISHTSAKSKRGSFLNTVVSSP